MVVHWDVNAFEEEISHNNKKHGEKFTSSKMDSRIFFSRHSISFLCKPRPRRPLEGYVRRSSSVQYEPWKMQNFHKMYMQPVSQTKCEKSSKNKESSTENSLD
ncbi:PREDICTED: uncharacterized protein LOC108692831 [Atta colombica]|uniref:uncharacterized protein LOC108692831 n=1 Tax=Atta colombica TaxID=520822 RepID=UPI00084BDA99|nr:PREDICTED: uncharacterized protein LOC108692831 [Atta colombica]